MMNKSLFWLLALLITPPSGRSNEIKVNSVPSLQQAINTAMPGERIILTNGIYTTSKSILVSRHGTPEKPIIIEAESTGGVEISGSNGFIISSGSSYLIIKGFRFSHNTGTFRIEAGAVHCTITRNLFECAPVESGTKPYLSISGDDCEVSYNTFRNKKDEGQMLSVQGPGGNRMAKRTWIHHNYFFNFIPPGKNNCSAIQIGLSGRSMDSAFCIVEYNLFEKTRGENEGAICHKACNNIIRFNTFGEESEECSIRHGNNSQIYGNFFINTTGLRFSGDGHLIFGNFFSNCKKAIVCTNGDGEVKEGSPLTCHDRADGVRILFNIITGCESAYQMPGRNNGLGATTIEFSDNLIRGGDAVSINGPYPDAVWKNNIIFETTGGNMPQTGFRIEDVHETRFRENILTAEENYPQIPRNNRPLTVNDVGQLAN